MSEFSQVKKPARKSWLVVGMLLSLVTIGVVGCGAKAATATASSSTSTAVASATQSTTSKKKALNPAIESAMGIRRLQSNEATVLTTDQKTTLKPILQTLIDTASPSADFLQQKADAITAVFTDAQKTYLSTNTQKDKPAGTSQSGQEPPKDQTEVQESAPDGNKTAPSGQSQDIFKQVLASLT